MRNAQTPAHTAFLLCACKKEQNEVEQSWREKKVKFTTWAVYIITSWAAYFFQAQRARERAQAAAVRGQEGGRVTTTPDRHIP
jgi:hypothetical protein